MTVFVGALKKILPSTVGQVFHPIIANDVLIRQIMPPVSPHYDVKGVAVKAQRLIKDIH